MLRIKWFSIFFFGCTFMNYSFSQKVLGDVTLQYEISAKSDIDNSAIKSFDGTKYKVVIKGQQSKTEMISKLGTETTLYDPKNKIAFILKEFSSQKLMVSLTTNDWTKKNQYLSKLKFKNTSETKNINGYNCTKAIAASDDGNQIEVYYTPEYKLLNTNYSNAFPDLNGLPVQFTIKSGNLNFTYTLQSINADFIPISSFDLPKSGFRIISYEEAMKISKG